ncbi:hypothetical protein PLICRDRAFT_658580 [Plicaturopsis crispa FD-325 SS-3]|nr:hypothetical protein PLICRDRAFT_658580 [Plicaturopsis crispa FD-325 SS-3]
MTSTLIRSAVVLILLGTVSAVDFHWRFYDNAGCDHASPPDDTYPANGHSAGDGAIGTCYSAPTGKDWNRLEIDNQFLGNSGVVTYCNIGCSGGETSFQKGTYCYVPPQGCDLGSFRVS